MPHGRVGGGSGEISAGAAPAGTITLGASTSGTTIVPIAGSGYLSSVNLSIFGTLGVDTITGGPAHVVVHLKRPGGNFKLCEGILEGTSRSVQGSGQLPIPSGGDLVITWFNATAAAIIVAVSAWVDEEAKGDSKPSWIDNSLPPGTHIEWIHAVRRIATQSNAGGGAIRVRAQLAANQVCTYIQGRFTGPASNTTLITWIGDEDVAEAMRLTSAGAAVSNICNLPSLGANQVTGGALPSTMNAILSGSHYLIIDAAAALQTETLTVAVTMRLNTRADLTWDTTGSAGTVAVATSTIAAAWIPVIV